MSADRPLPPLGSGRLDDRPEDTSGHSRRLPPGGGWMLASWIVLAAVAAITVMVAALFIGLRLDDRQINRHLGTATATVLSVSPLQTGIEFVDAAGATVRPPTGVLYPGLLSVGQQFMIEYSTLDPTVVRVAGRTAAVGNLVLGVTVVATVGIGLLLVVSLRRRAGAPSGRQSRRGRSAIRVAR